MHKQYRPTVAEISSGAITANVRSLAQPVAPALICVAVKADGYGHGAVTAANAAIAGGATWLAVALVEEAIALREAGIAAPILLLGEFPTGSAHAVVQHRITPTVYSMERISELSEAVPNGQILDVHLKVDTGMRRVGAQLDEVVELAASIDAAPRINLGGVFTHFAVSDEPANPFTDLQLDRFDAVLAALSEAGVDPGLVHASNSGGGIVHRQRATYDMVRFGVAIYGSAPSSELNMSTYGVELKPAMTLKTAVSHIKTVQAGDAVSYGHIWTAPEPRTIATIPIGYADGVPRALGGLQAPVLVRGRRVNMVGRVTMDQILIDCGPANSSDVQRGDDVILLGASGNDRITPWDWALLLGTIPYEITCGISARVPRISVP